MKRFEMRLEQIAKDFEQFGFTVTRATALDIDTDKEYLSNLIIKKEGNKNEIWISPIGTHNGYDEMVTIDYRVYRPHEDGWRLIPLNDKKIRCRFDASEKVFNNRFNKAIEIFERA